MRYENLTGSDFIRMAFAKADSHPYYFVVPRYVRTSAGVRVLHTLAHYLNTIGFEAYLTNPDTNPQFFSRYLSQEVIDSHYRERKTPIVVYPEVISGNPLSGECVVRFLGNFPGHLGGDSSFGQEEMVFGYTPELLVGQPKDSQENVLCLPVVDPGFFVPPPVGSERKGACFYADKYKKVHGGRLLPLTDGCLEITRGELDSQSPHQIVELFQRSECFYAYENTALSLEALLCGCPVVLVPNPYFNDVIGKDAFAKYGVAWGDSAEELEKAKSTVVLARENYLKRFDDFSPQFSRFIRLTQERAKNTPYTTIVTRGQLPISDFDRCYFAHGEFLSAQRAGNRFLMMISRSIEILAVEGLKGFFFKAARKLLRLLHSF